MEPFQESPIHIFNREGLLMYVRNRNIIIVCEGASEKAYIQELNRYLEEKEIHCILSPAARDFGLSCTRYLL
jgi:hypothetical protein